MTARNWPVNVRIARPDDRDAVLAFATSTWDGWDYIPQVWDTWVVPSEGVVLIATVGAPLNGDEPLDADGAPIPVGRPIAMTRIAMLSATEAWVEGIRVSPRVRGMSVATDLQSAELRWIAAHGANVVRYMTGEQNVGSQRLGARHGLLEVGRWRTYNRADHQHDEAGGHAIPTDQELALLGKAQKSDWPRIRDDPALEAGHGLYEYRPWAFQALSEERFRQHVERVEVLSAAVESAWAGVIFNRSSLADGQFHIAFAGGEATVLLQLLGALGRPEIRLPAPSPARLGNLGERLIADGYEPWDQGAIVVERLIDAAHPLPETNDASRLVYGDEPRLIAIAKALV